MSHRKIQAAFQVGKFFLKRPNNPVTEVAVLEANLSKKLNLQAVGVGSGSAALLSILQALGVKSGESVATSAFGCSAIPSACHFLGIKNFFVDIEPGSLAISAREVEAVIADGRHKVKAVIFVHWFGVESTEIQEIKKITDQAGIPLIEDLSQVFANYLADSKTRPRLIGTVGFASLSSGKSIATIGNAGVVFSNNQNLIDTVRVYTSYGSKSRNEPIAKGTNFRMDAIHAYLIRTSLKEQTNTIPKKRSEQVRRCAASFSSLEEITILYTFSDHHPYPQLALRVRDRDKLHIFLNSKLPTSVVEQIRIPYPKVLPGFVLYESPETTYPVAKLVADDVLTVPLYPNIATATLKSIIANIKAFYEQTE